MKKNYEEEVQIKENCSG